MRRTNPSHLRLGDRCRSSPSICIDPRGSRSHSRRPCLYSSKRGVILHFYWNFAIKTNTSCSIPKKASPTSLVQNQEGQNPMVHQKDFPPNKFSAQKSLLRTAVFPDGSASCVNERSNFFGGPLSQSRPRPSSATCHPLPRHERHLAGPALVSASATKFWEHRGTHHSNDGRN